MPVQKKSASNVLDDPTQSLQKFDLLDLQRYTHEKARLASDVAKNPALFNTSIVVGESATHQITHTKGFVADGKVGAEGSTN